MLGGFIPTRTSWGRFALRPDLPGHRHWVVAHGGREPRSRKEWWSYEATLLLHYRAPRKPVNPGQWLRGLLVAVLAALLVAPAAVELLR